MSNETKARQVARRAFKEAGVEPTDHLLNVLADRIEVTEEGRVQGADGRSVWDSLQDLQSDPEHAAAFVRLRPSYESKKWAEMTPDEKVEYTGRKYADAPAWGAG
jgi:hypothetical protein